MTTEERLVEALRGIDLEPGPDLYARLERSIEEDRAHRRRLLIWIPTVMALLLVVAAWVLASPRTGPAGQSIESWRLVIAYLALGGGAVVGLGPNLRRFGTGFLDGVFFLDPSTGRKFIQVLDIAYYAVFVGLLLVDADTWQLGESVMVWAGVEQYLEKLAIVLGVMGVFHAVNVVALPLLGLVFNSTVRREERRRAGSSAPVESVRARRADSNAQTIVIVVLVLALALLLPLVVGGPLGGLAGLFD